MLRQHLVNIAAQARELAKQADTVRRDIQRGSMTSLVRSELQNLGYQEQSLHHEIERAERAAIKELRDKDPKCEPATMF
jgi:hypothetical protein